LIPFSSTVPREETWRGFELQRGAGVQATLVILTLVMWAPVPVTEG
jgi:hypothetical protein